MADNNFMVSVNAILKWPDRRQVYKQIETLPVPYALAFLRENVSDLKFWKLLAKANMEMDDSVVKAIMAFGIQADRAKRTQFPKKKKKEATPPAPFRSTDKYWENIVVNDIRVTNEARHMGDALPDKVGKRRRRVVEWL